MSSWEERMAQRAAERKAAAKNPDEPTGNPHYDRHVQIVRGSGIECSCGEHLGVFGLAINPDDTPSDYAVDQAHAVLRFDQEVCPKHWRARIQDPEFPEMYDDSFFRCALRRDHDGEHEWRDRESWPYR